MNLSLNFSQPVSNCPRKKKKGGKPRARPEVVSKVLDYVTQHYAATGLVPTKRELSASVSCGYQATCLAWNELLDKGLLPADLLEARDQQRQASRKARTCHQHTGDCTPAMADKIFNLLKTDNEARLIFHLMQRGIIRKDL